MAQSVRERTSELAVLKTLGFTGGTILALVLAESLFIVFVGGGLGLAVAWLFVQGGDPTGGMLPIFVLPPRDVAIGVALMVCMGLLAGAAPPGSHAPELPTRSGNETAFTLLHLSSSFVFRFVGVRVQGPQVASRRGLGRACQGQYVGRVPRPVRRSLAKAEADPPRSQSYVGRVPRIGPAA